MKIKGINLISFYFLPSYFGSPIGTSYDLRVYAVSNSDVVDEKTQKRYTVRLGVRMVHKFQEQSDLFKINPYDQNHGSSMPRLRMKLLSPKARKLIKQTSLIIQRKSNSSTKTSLEPEETKSSSEIGAQVSFLNLFT